MAISNAIITQDFPCSGIPRWCIANAGIQAIDVSTGIVYKQYAIPYGSNWQVYITNQIYNPPSGTGDVVGPAGATDNDIPLFNGVTGKLIKDSGKKLSDYQDKITATGNITDYYGGDLAFHALPAPGTGDVVGPAVSVDDDIALFNGITGKLIKDSGVKVTDFVAANLPIVPATKTKITYDADGLVTAGADATTSDIAEGSNLYFTDERAQDAALGIANTEFFQYDDATPGFNLTAKSGGAINLFNHINLLS